MLGPEKDPFFSPKDMFLFTCWHWLSLSLSLLFFFIFYSFQGWQGREETAGPVCGWWQTVQYQWVQVGARSWNIMLVLWIPFLTVPSSPLFLQFPSSHPLPHSSLLSLLSPHPLPHSSLLSSLSPQLPCPNPHARQAQQACGYVHGVKSRYTRTFTCFSPTRP